MNEKYNIEDKHEIASIINHCLNDGYCDASMLARRITQAGYGNNNRVRKEFVEKLKTVVSMEMVIVRDCTGEENILRRRIDVDVLLEKINELLKEYENDN